MADRSFSLTAHGQGRDVTLLKRYATLEVQSIDESDTVTPPSYTTIDNAKAVNLVDGADVSVSVVGNVITVDEVGLSGAHIIITIVGS